MRLSPSGSVCSIVFTLFAIAAAPSAQASEPSAEGEEGRTTLVSRHRGEAHHRVQVGLNGAGLWTVANGTGHLGASGVIEFVAVPGWLEVALYAGALFAQGGSVAIPIDLLLIKPFHLTRRVHPFIGAGGTLVPVVEPHGVVLNAGLATAAGAHVWILNDVALTFEFNYNLLREGVYTREDTPAAEPEPAVASAELAHGMVHELGATTGFLLAW